jgi:Mn-dependent DtxR family transcriptional regulator
MVMHLQESAEMYLETIYLLSQKRSNVRSIDVAEHMGYSKPSVSRAVGLLKQGGYVTVDQDGFLLLTEDGKAVAAKVFERHTVLSRFLVSLGVSEDTASEDACKIEHVISDETLAAIKHSLHMD